MMVNLMFRDSTTERSCMAEGLTSTAKKENKKKVRLFEKFYFYYNVFFFCFINFFDVLCG